MLRWLDIFLHSLWLWSLLLYSLSEVCNFLLNAIFFRLSFQVTSFRRFFQHVFWSTSIFLIIMPLPQNLFKPMRAPWTYLWLTSPHSHGLSDVIFYLSSQKQTESARLECWGTNESRGGFNHYIALLALSWSWLSEHISDEFAAEVTSGEVLCHVDRAQCEC